MEVEDLLGSAPSSGTVQDPSAPETAKAYFAGYALDIRSGELTCNGKRIYLQQQPLEVLRMLLATPGEMVSREQLRERLWPGDTFVDFEHGLNKAVQKLRTALGDSPENPRFIETVPRRGYRFVAPLADPASQAEVRPTVTAPPIRTRPRHAIAALAMALLLGLLVNLASSKFSPRPTTVPGLQRLAVLPFANLSGDSAQEYFSDGMTEEMIAYLSRYDSSRLAVIARTSAMAYKGSRKTVAQIGRELDVDYILEGSVRRDGNRVRITAQLIQVQDQSHRWAESYERELSGIFPVQKDIAVNVAREIGLQLTRGAPAPLRTRIVQPEAYEAFLRGLSLWHSGRQRGAADSVDHFKRAIALQPDYAEAYAWLAFAYNRLASGEFVPPKEGYPLAKAAALRAIEIDDSLPEGHAALGFILRNYEWDWAGSERELKKALLSNPNNPVSNHVYGLYLSTVGRHEEAIGAIKRAAVLDPLSRTVASGRGLVYVNARRFQEARAVAQSRRELDGANPIWWGHFLLSMGEYPQALNEFERAPRELPGLGDLAGKIQAYAGIGKTHKARALLQDLKAHPQARAILSPYIARIHGQLGEFDEAFRWLDVAVEERAARLIFLKVDPAWDPLRADPRFQSALRRMNLAD
ncbi:MAG TPA: winged helix-turn-helix domain-containing protein [Terriglobales bacterium]|nr:winged helix-turn-helix domain-containing protein [Terriglobales bacterium]